MSKPTVFIVHGQGQTPTGAITRLASLLNAKGFETECPLLPHADPRNSGLDSIDVLNTTIGVGPAVVVGLGLGGFVAAKLQELRTNLTVLAVSSPDISGFTHIGTALGGRRVYVFSSVKDSVIRGKTARWAGQAEVFDLPKLDHHSENFLSSLAEMVEVVANGGDLHAEIQGLGLSE